MTAEYVSGNRKRLRTGFTTGTCAAGAAKACVLMALHHKKLNEIDILMPDGNVIVLPLVRSDFTENGAVAAIEKDGGDDPDITTGLHITAEVTLNHSGKVQLQAGDGVGMVTLKGLKIPVGEAAINPVPRGMIITNVKSVLPKGCGAVVTISVPGGKEIAKRTFNPRLGIKNGISILGSTGIVHPMSEDALKESLSLELSVLVNRGYRDVIFAFGNYGLAFLRENGVCNERIVKVSNYIGYMLDDAVNQGIERLVLTGHIGKMVKVAGGIFHTHNRSADCRLEILTAYAGLAGASHQVQEAIYHCCTTGEAVTILEAEGLNSVYERIVRETIRRSELYVYSEIEISAVLFGDENKLLYMDKKAEKWLKEMKNE